MSSTNDWINESQPYITPRDAGQSDAWTEGTARRGRSGSQWIREVAEVEPPVEVAQALGLAAGELAVVRRRVILLDDQAVELADTYYPATIARGTVLAEPAKIRGGAVTALAALGHRASHVTEEVTARLATNEEQHHFGLADGQPVLVLVRVVVSDAGLPIEVSVMTSPAAGRKFVYRSTVN